MRALRPWLMAGLLTCSACDVFDEDLEALIENDGGSGSTAQALASDSC